MICDSPRGTLPYTFMTSLMDILPGVVRELVKQVPEIAFDITDWGSVKRDLPLLTRRIFLGTGVDELRQAQEKRLGRFVRFSPSLSKNKKHKEGQPLGDGLLRYYFAQLFCPEGIFVDLRTPRISMDSGFFTYCPSGFWYQFSDSFRVGILTLYDGFYRFNDSKFEEGLIATGLLDSAWAPADQEEIKTLFRSHFGSSLEHPMSFTLVGFQESFLRIFQFLLRKKVKLSSEFMIFGIYLVTLYLALEEWGEAHDVKSLYLEVAESNSY